MLDKLAEQTAARINAVGAMQNEHIFTFQKALDWNYEIGRTTPSLPEAIGIKQFLESEKERLAGELESVEAAQTSSANA